MVEMAATHALRRMHVQAFMYAYMHTHTQP